MARKILLTGAGFTHNFGAPLVGGMWAQIFNNPLLQQQDKIQKLLSDTFNYEGVYDYVVHSGEYNVFEKQALSQSVLEAFEFVDYVVRIPNPNHRDIHHGAIKIIEHFTQELGGEGYIFTLNQDLYLERKCRIPRIKFTAPGLTKDKISTKDMSKLLDEDYVTLPSEEELAVIRSGMAGIEKNEIYYVKLHGSHHWHDSRGKKQLVLADDLVTVEEPLLKWYRQIFEEAISQPNTQLLVIGYSFRDDYVNRILAKNVMENGLQIQVLSPIAPQVFKGKLNMRVMGKEIYQGLSGYYECGFNEMFPKDTSLHLSQHWQNLERNYFKN